MLYSLLVGGKTTAVLNPPELFSKYLDQFSHVRGCLVATYGDYNLKKRENDSQSREVLLQIRVPHEEALLTNTSRYLEWDNEHMVELEQQVGIRSAESARVHWML
ncbi:hypothetical protein ACJJTC_015614 [Scirpophaga incertulas]